MYIYDIQTNKSNRLKAFLFSSAFASGYPLLLTWKTNYYKLRCSRL